MLAPVTKNKDLEDLESKYNDRRMLWQNVSDFNRLKDEWYKGSFDKVDSEIIEKEMKTFDNSII